VRPAAELVDGRRLTDENRATVKDANANGLVRGINLIGWLADVKYVPLE
jgi:hypothetical protein